MGQTVLRYRDIFDIVSVSIGDGRIAAKAISDSGKMTIDTMDIQIDG